MHHLRSPAWCQRKRGHCHSTEERGVPFGRSLQVLPVGTAYAVWTGIGAVGTVLMGVVLFGDAVRVGCIARC